MSKLVADQLNNNNKQAGYLVRRADLYTYIYVYATQLLAMGSTRQPQMDFRFFCTF